MENLERCHLPQPKELRLAWSERDCAVSTSRVPVRLLCETPTMKHQWSVSEAKTMSWWWTSQKYPSCGPEKTSIRDDHVAIVIFDEAFLTNDFGHACDVCNRLWFRRDLKSPMINHVAVLRTEFDDPNFRTNRGWRSYIPQSAERQYV
jgi:hypothetical protein